MAPAFGLAEVKGLLPYFMDSTTKACELCFHLILKPNSSLCHQMADKWNDIIENSESGYSAVVDANMWLGKAALDTYVPVSTLSLCGLQINFILRIGAGAFDYDFGALDEADNPLTKSYTDIMYGHLSSPVVHISHHANHLPCSPVLRPSGTPPNYSFSSCPLRDGSQDCSHGFTITPVIPEC